jgi:hypothetical protein
MAATCAAKLGSASLDGSVVEGELQPERNRKY